MTEAVTQRLRIESGVGPGPETRRLRRRVWVAWLAAAVVGLLPVLVGAPAWVQVVGAGLWFPGGGFAAEGEWGWALLCVVLFVVAVIGWLVVGGFVFPVVVWSGSAVVSAVWVDASEPERPWAALGAVAVFVALVKARGWWSKRRRSERAAELDTELRDIELVVPRSAGAGGGELDAEDVGAMRYILDRLLQPLDEFSGFTTIDQFREAAWRYQLSTASYALAALQTERLPAFTGYLHEAQRRAHLKMLDRRVWHYWRVENLLGNGRWDPDPIRRENIMLSGWWALGLGAFERATGSREFSQPGSLPLVERPGKEYVYDYPSVVDALGENFDATRLCLFPCEPNWVFSVCNLYGMTGALVFDRAHGTDVGRSRLEQFNRRMEEEFVQADGRSVVILSRRSGLAISGTGPMAIAGNVALLNMTSPRLAQSLWHVMRSELDRRGGVENLAPGPADLADPGNYQLTGAFFWAALMLGAREMGDDEVYERARAGYAAAGISRDDGTWEWSGSTMANTYSHIARFGRDGTWYRFAHGDVGTPLDGPHLAEAPYPQVIVTRAEVVSDVLHLTLLPGDVPAPDVPLTISGLRPGARYRVENEDHLASHEGALVLTAQVLGRTEISVAPVA